jgi:hypothetical protein
MADDIDSLPVEEQLRRFRRTIRFRNIREWVACGIVVIAFGAMAASAESTLSKLSAAEIVGAAIFVAWKLYRDGRAPADRPSSSADARETLVRGLNAQADLLSSVPRWYVAPLAVGWLGLQVGRVMHRPPRWGDAAAIAGGVLFGMFVIWLNRLAARRMREQVARLTQPAM